MIMAPLDGAAMAIPGNPSTASKTAVPIETIMPAPARIPTAQPAFVTALHPRITVRVPGIQIPAIILKAQLPERFSNSSFGESTFLFHRIPLFKAAPTSQDPRQLVVFSRLSALDRARVSMMVCRTQFIGLLWGKG
jgi:hypothetical protein